MIADHSFIEKLKFFFKVPAKKTSVIPDINSGYNDLVEEINNYFNQHPSLKKPYEKELAFLNSQFSILPGVDKKVYAILPYSFILNYDYRDLQVFKCDETPMHYVLLDEKKVYYPEEYTPLMIQLSFIFLLVEQHKDSPHRYDDENFKITENDVVADIGTAEGNFAITIADKAKKLILVEAEPRWKEPLRKTFEPWSDKVIFINKMISDTDNDQNVRLDKICAEHKVTAIKMDIEGSELDVLKTAEKYIANNQTKMAITTYHKENDAQDIKMFLENNNYETVFTEGYMLFIHDKLKPPFFRQALIKTKIGSNK